MRLRHCHVPGITPYTHGDKIQNHLVRQFLNHKASPTTTTQPPPTILTCQFSPVYTCGRREIGTVSPEQAAHLRADGAAHFHEALRGGQTTFHGPGQLVAYPILDLKRHKLSARSYVCVLEKSLIATCARWGVATRTTDNVGVWVDEENKIASIGIHLRRNVTGHGVGLNVDTDLSWFRRIVACGLEDKLMTSLAAEGVQGVDVNDVGKAFVEEMAERLDGVQEVVNAGLDEIMPVHSHEMA